MNIFIAGDTHGKLEPLYDKVLKLEDRHGITADWVLQTGNLGVWPDPHRIDRATRMRSEVDFYRWYLEYETIPRPTLFVAGKHEDHRWLNFMYSRGHMEILPNLNWLLNGYKTHIGNGEQLSIVGLGKVYSPLVYRQGKRKIGAYTRHEVERACSQGPTDLLICHEAGKGARLGTHLSEAEGINNICYATRPKLMIHGHYNVSQMYKNPITGTPTISLAFEEIRILQYENEMFNVLA